MVKVHVLIALTFHGPPPTPKHCALHKDDDRYHNHYKNIYWGTKKQNAIDRSINGHHGLAKLTFEQALITKELYHGDRWTYKEIAELFGVSMSTIAQIITGKTFKWTSHAYKNLE